MTELVFSLALLLAAMSVMVKVLAWVGAERQASERRQWAVQELSNAMERVVSEPFDRVTTGRAGTVLADVPRLRFLNQPEWDAKVEDEKGTSPPSRRVSLRLRWKTRSGEWDAPVRLTSWVYQGRTAP